MSAGFWLAGRRVDDGEFAEVRHPGSGELIAHYVVPGPEHVGLAAAACLLPTERRLSTTWWCS